MTLSVRRHATAQEFLDTAEEWLLRREAEHNLILSLAGRLREPSDAYGTPIYYATIEAAGGELVGCALRTPPFKLHVTSIDVAAAGVLAEDVARVYEEIPAILGRRESALAAGKAWCALRGGVAALGKSQRIYQLDRVQPLDYATGTLREATMENLDLVTEWADAFHVEVHDQARASRAWIHERITSGSLFLWEAGGSIVSMASVTGETRNGARIGIVYTPAEVRGHGYASACVAALSQAVLDDGKVCFLFTDLANPTSNAIYQRIGYTPVCDVVDCIIERTTS